MKSYGAQLFSKSKMVKAETLIPVRCHANFAYYAEYLKMKFISSGMKVYVNLTSLVD